MFITRLNGNVRGALCVAVLFAMVGLALPSVAVGGDYYEDDSYDVDDFALMIRDALEAGDLTDEEARDAYFHDVFPGSDAQAKIDRDYDRVVADIDHALSRGEINQQVADSKIAWAQEHRQRQMDMAYNIEVGGMSHTEAEVERARLELDARVERGDMTRDQAREKLQQVEAEAAAKQERRRQVMEGEKSFGQAYLERVEARFAQAVQNGQMSQEQADRSLERVRQQVEEREAREREAIETGESNFDVELAAAEEKIQELVERGQLSESAADAFMGELRRKVAIEEAVIQRMHRDGVSKAEAYHEVLAEQGEPGAQASDGDYAYENEATGSTASAQAQREKKERKVPPDIRLVLGAARKVHLTGDQKGELRDIRRSAIRDYRKISRKDKSAQAAFAQRIKGQIVALLDSAQTKQYDEAIKQLEQKRHEGKKRSTGRKSGGNAKRSAKQKAS